MTGKAIRQLMLIAFIAQKGNKYRFPIITVSNIWSSSNKQSLENKTKDNGLYVIFFPLTVKHIKWSLLLFFHISWNLVGIRKNPMPCQIKLLGLVILETRSCSWQPQKHQNNVFNILFTRSPCLNSSPLSALPEPGPHSRASVSNKVSLGVENE